jgi:NADPH:quinone reductase-like Zn-dependent oxidoreductase
VAFFIVLVTAAAFSEIAKLLQAGRLKTRVRGVMPLADVRIAHEMHDGTRPRPRGRIVLSLE